MIVDELLSQAGLVAVLLIAAGIVIAIARSRRPGATRGQQRAGRIAQVVLIAALLMVACVFLLFVALAESDSRFRF